MRNSKLSLAVLALVIGASAVQAQTNSGTIAATATVLTPINVTSVQPLAFGNVFPGVNKSVAATDLTNAGRLDVTGQVNAPVTLSFTLPATLSSGANTMPIDSYTGMRADNSAQTVGAALFSPGPSNAATLSPTGTMFVWVGARVVPATNQAQGVYTANVTMTVVY
jgi:hypothetical protein